MLYEMRTYRIKPGMTSKYLEYFEQNGLPIISRYLTLVGWWYTEVGQLNQVIHIWEYATLDERTEKREALYNDPEWVENFLPTALSMIEKQESQIMNASNFSPIR
jgi:hypothetical protein